MTIPRNAYRDITNLRFQLDDFAAKARFERLARLTLHVCMIGLIVLTVAAGLLAHNPIAAAEIVARIVEQ